MATTLVKGQNGPLSAADVVISTQVGAAADLSALLVTDQGRVRTDSDFVFYNQPSGPGVQLRGGSGGAPGALAISLGQVPADISQIRAVITLDGAGATFGRIAPPTALVADANGNALYEYRIDGLSTESIVIAVELYRRGGAWKVRAVGQGYAGGFAALVTDHGVSVGDTPTPNAAHQPPSARAHQPPPAQAYPPPTQPFPAAGRSYPPPPPAPAPAYPPPAQSYPPPTQSYPQPAQSYPPPAPYSAPAQSYPPSQPPPNQPPPYQSPAPQPQQPPPPTQPFPATPPSGEVSLAKGRPVSLAKGQKVTLRKEGGVALTRIRMGLGWDPAKRGGLFGSRTVNIDLDAWVAMFDSGNLVDVAYYGQLTSKDGSIRHQGDNLTGEGEGDDEVILVDLNRIPARVSTLLFIVTSYQGQTFEQVSNAYCRLIDETTAAELARYSLAGGMPFTGIVMAKMFRADGTWKLQAMGDGFQAKHPGEAVPQLGRFL
ncbi:TerD family protein [Nocardia jejuensis]|uniref:TerD family protein n=1 Tax=Nocardia jejuensis TaxID=328049 RepID=UPI0008373CF5|nr:TerD family protein [Nocardia jejuensis]